MNIAQLIKNSNDNMHAAIEECEKRCKFRDFDYELETVTYTFADKSKIIHYLGSSEYRAYDR